MIQCTYILAAAVWQKGTPRDKVALNSEETKELTIVKL